MPCIPVLRYSDLPEETRPEAGEVKSGVLEIVNSTDNPTFRTRQRLFVRVYRTSSEHFAILFPLKGLVMACKPVSCINLKSCNVEAVTGTENQFTVAPRLCESGALTFAVPEKLAEKSCIQSWINAMRDCEKAERKRTLSDSRKFLPVLVEEEE